MTRYILCVFCLLTLVGCSTNRAGFSGSVDSDIDTFVKAGPPKDAGFASDNPVDSRGELDVLSLDSIQGTTIDTVVNCMQQVIDNGYANVKQGQLYYTSCDSCKMSVYKDGGGIAANDAGDDLEVSCAAECRTAIDCLRDHWPCSTTSCVASCVPNEYVGNRVVFVAAVVCCPVIGDWATVKGC
jgi:hypothetical protein